MTWPEIKNHPDFNEWAWFDQYLVSEFDDNTYLITYDFESDKYQVCECVLYKQL